jgi:hypothetical protein
MNTKISAIALAALTVSGMGLTSTASAEDLSLAGLSLKLGIKFPLDNTVSTAADSFTMIGLDFAGGNPLGKGGDSFFTLDYHFKNIAKKPSILAASYNQRFSKTQAVGSSYAILGFGIASMDIGASGYAYFVRGGLGKTLSDHTFVEAIGTFSSKTTSGSYNTIGLVFGYKF